jgi:hypothetical protein
LRGFFLSCLKRLDNQFPGLFEEPIPNGNDTGTVANGSGSFSEHYGWIYSTEQVAEFERISLEQAYELDILQYLNDLVYIKAKRKEEEKQIEKLKK